MMVMTWKPKSQGLFAKGRVHWMEFLQADHSLRNRY